MSHHFTTFTRKTFRTLFIAALLLGLTLALTPAQAAPDATFVVDTTADTDDVNSGDGICADSGGDCSLRAAISEANALAGADTITLPAGTYTLAITGAGEHNNTTGDLDITSSITINGAGADNTVIQAGTDSTNGVDRVFHVVGSSDELILNDVTLRYGLAAGGGVYNAGMLTISNSTIANNSGSNRGGGVYNYFGTLTIENSTISDNSASAGGGVYSQEGDVTIQNSAIISNTATGAGGGGMYINSGTVDIENSTISYNSGGAGGGVYNYSGTLGLENSTISHNSATDSSSGGGGFYSTGTLNLAHCTITGNSGGNDGGGGIRISTSSTANIKNTIVADNNTPHSTTSDCRGAITSQGYNLVGDGTGCPSGGTGDQTTSDPKLGPLQDNGGPTETQALLDGSPAFDAIPNAASGCGSTYTTDQRGEARPSPTAGSCDVGAYEEHVPEPEIDVQRPPWISISDGGTDNIGNQHQGAVRLTYTLDNTQGDVQLEVTDITAANLSGVSNFSLDTAAPITVTGGTKEIFDISFDVLVNGAFSLDLEISNNDNDEHPYNIAIQGVGIPPPTQLDVDTTIDSNDAAYQQCTAAANDCSLRGAISKANSDTATDYVINLSAETYTLTGASGDNGNASGDLDITSDITINGVDADLTIIQAGTTNSNGVDRVFHIINSSVDLTLNDVTVRYGRHAETWGGGGGIDNNSGTLNINNSVIFDNYGKYGGGIFINDNGMLNIKNSTISNNSTNKHGGGIYVDAGSLVNIQNSTISGNTAGDMGGGIGMSSDVTLNAGNVTISGNTASSYGGGISSYATTANFSSSTLAGNSAGSGGGGIYTGGGAMELQNTIVTGSPGNECWKSGGSVTGKDNWIDDTSCGSDSAFRLGAVTQFDSTRRDNGGPTETHALLTGSNAIDAVPDCTYVSDGNNPLFSDNQTVSADQRGEIRPRGGLCDAGAYESPFILWDGEGGADTNTSTPANWSGDVTPAATDIPVFDDGASSNNATVDGNLTVGGWVINTGYSGAISQGGYNLTVNGDWQQLGGTFTGGGGTLDLAGVFDLSGGTFTAPSSDGLLTVGGGFSHTGGTFDPNGGRVVLDNTSDQTLATTFNDLYLNDGLLGYWKLDEGSGTTVTDSSGYGYDGTLVNSPTWSADTPGTMDFHDPYALSFDRADGDYVAIPSTTGIDDLQQFTIAAWVKLDSTPAGNMRFVTLGNEKACLRYDDTDLHFYVKIDPGGGYSFYEILGDSALSSGVWYHVAGTYDGSDMRLYLDGTAQSSTVSVSGTVHPGNGVTLSGGETLDGTLDDVRVYDRALSAAEIGDLADGKHPQTSVATTTLGAALDVNGDLTLNSGTLEVSIIPPVGYWKLDEDSGATAADSSGNSNDGTLNGDPTWTTTVAPTSFGNSHALDFDGAGDYVAINGVADDVSGGTVTIAFWVKTPADTGNRTLVAVNTASQDNVMLLSLRDNDEFQVYDAGSAAWEGDTNAVVADDTWHHLAYTSDGTTGRLYVDGVEKATHTPNYAFSSDDLWSLAQEWDAGGPGDYLDGILDDVRVYDQVLSADAIQILADGDEIDTDINLAGDFTRNGGVFEPGGGTVTFDGSGAQTLDTDVIPFYDLTVSSGVTLVDLADFTVDGTLTNNGSLRQTNDAPNGSTTQFLRVLNQAGGATKYYGIDITPSGDMGATTVTISGNQDCTTDDTSQPVRRCFEISPGTSQTAAVAFWYLESERNGNTAGIAKVFHWEGGAWVQETGAYTRGDDGTNYSVQVTGVDNYSPFVLDDAASPTAVTVQDFRASPHLRLISYWERGAVLALLVLVGGGVVAMRRRGREQRP